MGLSLLQLSNDIVFNYYSFQLPWLLIAKALRPHLSRVKTPGNYCENSRSNQLMGLSFATAFK